MTLEDQWHNFPLAEQIDKKRKIGGRIATILNINAGTSRRPASLEE